MTDTIRERAEKFYAGNVSKNLVMDNIDLLIAFATSEVERERERILDQFNQKTDEERDVWLLQNIIKGGEG
jgi:hypothetical protein